MRCRALAALFSLCLSFSIAIGAQGESTGPDLKWTAFPDAAFELRGLPWFKENFPELWRFPKRAEGKLPKAVWARAVAPDGGRIRFKSNTRHVAVRVVAATGEQGGNLDLYEDGEYIRSAPTKGTNTAELLLFEGTNQASREFTIYLPNRRQIRVLAIGLDPGCTIEKPAPFRLEKPIVCYGSSVLQGTGAKHPSKTYPAVLARLLNLDFINLGFGGAGKAEPEVVRLVSEPEACCYIFDLGKSYGAQGPEAYGTMLDHIRAAHPKTPIICVTPIYATKEATQPDYVKKSEDLRTLMREAAMTRRKAGDKLMFVSEGLELFGPADKDAFNDPLHPNDEGNERMGKRLAGVVKRVVIGER